MFTSKLLLMKVFVRFVVIQQHLYIIHITELSKLIHLNKKVPYIDVIAYKYDCLNESCNRGVIMQDLPFVSASQRRTDNLNCLILAVSLFLSNEGASKVLKLLGINISNDSIKG